MTTVDKSAMLGLLSGDKPAQQGNGPDVFTGLGEAYTSKKSAKLPIGRHVCKIEGCKINNGTKGVFFIIEFALIQTSVDGLPLGSGYAMLVDPTKKTRFQPWLKGLIRAVLKLDYSAESEARLVAEAADIARAAVDKGVLNGHIFGVNNVEATSQNIDPATGKGRNYVRQDWFAADAP